MTRAVLVNFHKYTPFGDEFYEPLLDFFLMQMEKYKGEYDTLYLLDSNWGITRPLPGNVKVIRTDPAKRYYDSYKEVLPQIKEDVVLFMDNDMVVYKENKINRAYNLIHCIDEEMHQDKPFDVVSIYDTIGTMKVDLPNGKNKFCPYWFATRKELLVKYLDVDWSPDAMPYTETIGLLTEAMLKDGVKPFEWEEDKNSIYFDGHQDAPKNLGYYHIRAGSTPAYLLATKAYGDINTYNIYTREQPRSEYLRQFAWYQYMLDSIGNEDIHFIQGFHITKKEWGAYMEKFREFHGL